MKLNLEEKQTFYHELGRFVRSGIALPQAVESLAADSRGTMRNVFDRLSELFLGGETTAGAFARLQPAIGPMEVTLIEASDRSGRLEQAFDYLSKYFGALETVRAGIIKETRWPVVQLHLAAFILSFSTDFVAGSLGGGGFNATHFLLHVAVILGIFYAVIAALAGGGLLVTRAARTNVPLDAFLARVPLIGKLRRNMAMGRFCAAYEMQLSAGVNAMDSLRAAGEASQSARVRSEVARMVPEMMAGTSVGALVAGRPVFPVAFQRSVRTGEETGTLDADLHRWADYYQKAATESLEAAGAWLSRAVTLAILSFVGYMIVTTFSKVMHATYDPLEHFGE